MKTQLLTFFGVALSKIRVTSLILAGFLHFAPTGARLVAVQPGLSASPAAIILSWVAKALAVAGAYHTVSAATGLVSASSITGKTGTRLTYQVKITGREVGLPKSWKINGQLINATGSTSVGMPGGLSFAMSTMIISGTPTTAATTATTMTAYEHANGGGGALTFTLTFNITASTAPPTISVQPLGGEGLEGGSFTLSVTATGTPAPTYAWKLGGVAISGATGSTLTLSPLKLTDAGSYTVDVSNSAGTVTSSAAVLTVKPAIVTTTISSQPKNAVVHAGESTTLSVTASGSAPLSYQWSHNGTNIANSTNSTLILTAVGQDAAGSYTVTVNGLGGSVTSDAATVKVVGLSLGVLNAGGGQVKLSFPAIAGRKYRIEASDNLDSPTWTAVGEITANGDSATLTDSAKVQRFWRCITLQP